MADQLEFREFFNDSDIIAGLERIQAELKQIQQVSDETGKKIDEAFHPDFALGVSDAVKDLKRKYTELKESANILRSALRNATDPAAIKLYGTALKQAEGGLKQLTKAAKEGGVSLKELNRQTSTGKEVFQSFFGQFTKAALIVKAIEYVVQFTKFAVGLSQQTAIATKQFQAFLGSAELAVGVVADLTAFSEKKFLNSEEVLSAGKGLLAFGETASNLPDVLGRIADISAATGKNFGELATIYGKARTAGVLYAEDINQLVDAGIPIIQEFAKQLGVSTDQVKKLASEGKIGFEELQLAFFNLTKEGATFANQAEAQAETLTGVWKNLFSEVKPAISAIGEFFSDIATGIGLILTDLVTGIKDAFGVKKTLTLDVDYTGRDAYEQAKDDLYDQQRLEEQAEKRRMELAAQANKDRRKELEKRTKDFRDALESIQRQADALNIDNTFDPIQKVIKQFDAAQAEVKKLEANLLKLATTPQQREAVKDAIEELFKEINAKYKEELFNANDEFIKLRNGNLGVDFSPLPPPDLIAKDMKYRAQAMVSVLQSEVTENMKSALDKIRDFIRDNIGPVGKELLQNAFADLTSGLNALTDAQVSQQDRIISALDARIQKQQEVLDKEKQFAQDGLANNVAIEQDKLDKLQAQRDEAEKKRLALEKRAATQQLVIDTAQQVSSLTTAAANVFKAESGKGLLGILFALSAIGVLFSTFSKAKALAAKSATPPKFRKGTKLEGPTHEGGGLAISDAAGNVVGEAEGGEWLIGTAPSREHDGFLKRLNKGEFRGVPLDRILPRNQAESPISGAVPRINRLEGEHHAARERMEYKAIVEAQERVGNRIVQAITEQPTIYPWKGGYKEVRRNGNVISKNTQIPE